MKLFHRLPARASGAETTIVLGKHVLDQNEQAFRYSSVKTGARGRHYHIELGGTPFPARDSHGTGIGRMT